MEDGLNVNPTGTQGSFIIKTNAESNNDILTRRLKNRERQRRYRARKRLETVMEKARVLNQSTIPQVELQLPGILNNGIKRVHCKRDWKKDARRAHTYWAQENTHNVSVQPAISLSTESQTLCLSSGIRVQGTVEREYLSENSLILGNCETKKTKVGRRDWKADARNKKT